MEFLDLDRPMCIFDTETTGTDPMTARIIEIALARCNTAGKWTTFETRLNPGCSIPEHTTAVHGITDADVTDAPRFRDVAERLFEMICDADIVGYNILGYDWPLLDQEFKRLEIDIRDASRTFLDALLIFRQHFPGPHTLADAHVRYTGKTMPNAHQAMADVRATFAVMRGQWAMHDLPRRPANAAAIIRAAWTDSGCRLLKSPDGTRIGFGKHWGKTIPELAATDARYLGWLRGQLPERDAHLLDTSPQKHLFMA